MSLIFYSIIFIPPLFKEGNLKTFRLLITNAVHNNVIRAKSPPAPLLQRGEQKASPLEKGGNKSLPLRKTGV